MIHWGGGGDFMSTLGRYLEYTLEEYHEYIGGR